MTALMSKKPNCESRLFYGFSLKHRVPQQHLLRSVHQPVDRQAIWRVAEPFYSRTGAPSVDPVVVLKMSLLGYFYGISSERRLAEECRLNLAFMWFLGYDLDEMPPDHSILSKVRARFGRELYAQFFGLVVKACRDDGLIVGDTLVMDATLLKANASLDSLASRSLHKELTSAQTYLDQLWAENPTGDADDSGKGSEPVRGPSSASRGKG
jgi:transposase